MRTENRYLSRVYHFWIPDGVFHPADHHDGHLPAHHPVATQKSILAQVKGDSAL